MGLKIINEQNRQINVVACLVGSEARAPVVGAFLGMAQAHPATQQQDEGKKGNTLVAIHDFEVKAAFLRRLR